MSLLTSIFTQRFLDAADGKLPEIHGPRKLRPKTIDVLNFPIIEKYFGKAHWITPGLWFGPIMAWGLYRGWTDVATGPLKTIGLFFTGWFILSFVEYCLHRWLFHMAAGDSPWGRVRAFLIHGYHHDFPEDEYRLVLPPLFIWPPAALVIIAYWFGTGPHLAPPLIAGSAVGYVAYDWVHYYTHHARPTSGVGKWLRRYHMVHHFKYPEACYGVSMPTWDLVFGTFKPIGTISEREQTEQVISQVWAERPTRGSTEAMPHDAPSPDAQH